MTFVYVSIAGTVLVFWLAAWVAGFVQGRRKRERVARLRPVAEVAAGVYVESEAAGPAPMPIVYGIVSDEVDGPASAGVIPHRYVGQAGGVHVFALTPAKPAADFGNMDDFAIDPMTPDSANLTVEQAAVAFELWQINRWKPQ